MLNLVNVEIICMVFGNFPKSFKTFFRRPRSPLNNVYVAQAAAKKALANGLEA